MLAVGKDEDEKVVRVSQLPAGAGEGTWLRARMEEYAVTEIMVDMETTEAAQARIRSKLDALRQYKGHHRPVAADDESAG